MKKLKYILVFFLLPITSCEDVIEVDLNNAEPRLVIDASLNWLIGTDGKNQSIQLSLTAPFFNETIPPATGATVTVTDSNNNIFNFIELENTGKYINNNFIPVLNSVYNLTILYNNETYTANETLTPIVPIEFVEQKNDGGFAGDEIEIKAFYNDPANIENFYLFEFLIVKNNSIYLEVYDDKFTDGNQIFAFFSDESLEAGDELIIKSSGISERNFEFMNILLQQTDDESGDPFETQPATVRGNCINKTSPNNYPLGYFRVSETSIFTYIID
ncbi:DUF4249 domain-containing protein [Flavivirga spongiicola]|uniref:DUF4249 domain-containing protein n=1 Tax=Flavivirga spongiicola TaxID=421621 RepID=A0ABU7XNE9_9FLAO|nr:DUF4249 domain-containing protein [Flavivirga sp. MEBiC05379]MDO5977290.1 DUF4249 domain-containing protein [Flavivirga sp. MEBiC05379]